MYNEQAVNIYLALANIDALSFSLNFLGYALILSGTTLFAVVLYDLLIKTK